MKGFLLDTHIWLWQLDGSPSLPDGLRQQIEESDADLWLSPVSVWEVALLHSRGRYDLGVPLRQWLELVLDRLPIGQAPLDKEVVLVSQEIDLPHRDPADRFLAATAVVYELTLLTVDPRLVGAPGVPTRSA